MSKFWADGVLTATFIINRLPSAILQWKSPYELLYDELLDFDRMRCFGCLCFASNIVPLKDKFAPRAFKCVFLGYVTGQKAYKVYDMENDRTLISRDVLFYEDQYPMFNLTDSSECPNPFPFLEPTKNDLISQNKKYDMPIINPLNSPPSLNTPPTSLPIITLEIIPNQNPIINPTQNHSSSSINRPPTINSTQPTRFLLELQNHQIG